MPSIVPGFEYDIFISYRQKDNRGDRWVTEFVNALKSELDATLKEDISIYFDESPHDGLLETHDVGDSLKGKLKCLIFIPIVSQTYCDPKSFAWKNEFLAFKNLANEDHHGLKIKLQNGNVASRVLPVRIHELDDHDKTVLENELGPIRAIDFVFKSAGVNRPLLSREEHPQDNFNKTYYRDQINKVANAVKEIIQTTSSPSKPDPLLTTSISVKTVNKKKLFYSLSTLLILMIGYFIYAKLSADRIEKSVAVLPFKTLSNDPEQKYFSFGIMEDIISRLYKIADLHVTSSTSALAFQNSDKNVRQIAGELGVRYILEGSVQKKDTDVRITVRLVDAARDENIWTNTFDYKMSNSFALQAELAEKVASSLEIKLTQLEKQQITKTGTKSNLAFEYYQKGKLYNDLSGKDNLEKSRNFFLKAIETDSTYAAAYSGLAEVGISFIDWGYASPNESASSILFNIKKAIALDSLLGEAYSALGAYHIYCSKDYDQAEKAFRKGIELNPGYDFTYFHYSVLQVIRKNQMKSLELLQHAINLNPLSVKFNVYKAQMDYYMFREYNKALKELDRILAIFPGDNFALWVQGAVYTQLGRFKDAEESFLKRTIPTKNLNWALACSYARQGKKEKAKEILSYLLEKEKKVYIMPTQIGCVYLELGDEANAWKYFTKASDANDYWLVYYGLDPALDPIRSDPRFKEILKKANLTN